MILLCKLIFLFRCNNKITCNLGFSNTSTLFKSGSNIVPGISIANIPNLPIVCPIPITTVTANDTAAGITAGQYLQVTYRCISSRLQFHPFAGNTYGGKIGQTRLRGRK